MPAPSNVIRSKAYADLWGIVDGAVVDAFKNHPDYLTPKGQRSARTSVVKRVCGTVLSFAEQSAQGRVRPAAMADRVCKPDLPASPSVGGAKGEGAANRLPNPHCRIGKVRFKRRSRYRAAGVFDLTTSALIASVKAQEGRGAR